MKNFEYECERDERVSVRIAAPARCVENIRTYRVVEREEDDEDGQDE
jgi:hypothetical protein